MCRGQVSAVENAHRPTEGWVSGRRRAVFTLKKLGVQTVPLLPQFFQNGFIGYCPVLVGEGQKSLVAMTGVGKHLQYR